MKKNWFETFCIQIVRPPYQVVMLCFTFAIVLILGWKAIGLYRPLEEWPEVKSIVPEQIKEWGGEPVVVGVGLYLTNWQVFDEVNSDFVVDSVVWFQFDPSLISLETIGKFSFEKGEMQSKSAPSTKLIDKKLFAEYKVRLRFTSTLNHQFFPLDDHHVYMTVVNTYVTPSEVIFQAYKSDFSMSKHIHIPGWRLVNRSVKAGYEEGYFSKFDERKVIRYPEVVFMLDFARSGISLTLLIFLPFFLIFFISIFWLGFEPDKTNDIMALTTGALASMIAYRFVIQGMSPKVGYFLLSDHIFTFFLALAFISFVIALVWVRHGKMTPAMIKMRGIVFISFHLLFIGVWYYLLFMWVKGL
ncbi:MAG TPA: hypothetical protein ENH91_01350 [Leeuwenhoekiella sp.]|nr:hypothetical protein [Leeuwenhoekiella sp.]